MQAVAQGITALAIISLLTLFVQSITENLFGSWVKGTPMKWIALVIGIATAFGFHVLLFTSLAGPYLNGFQVNPYVDMLFSGVVMGQGSSFLHQLVNTFFPTPPAPPNP